MMGVKAESTFVYWGQIACKICILKRSTKGWQLYVKFKVEENFVDPKLQFLGGKN